MLLDKKISGYEAKMIDESIKVYTTLKPCNLIDKRQGEVHNWGVPDDVPDGRNHMEKNDHPVQLLVHPMMTAPIMNIRHDRSSKTEK